MSKHTPGPWVIRHEFNVFAGERLVANAGGHSSNVMADRVHSENEANARLIAAAPVMHDLLVECLANSPDRRSDWRDRVEAVLAEIRGEP